MIPLFSSHYSTNSILTLDKPDEIKPDRPVSIFSIAKKHNLERVFLVEKRMSGFVEAYKNSPCPFIFSVKLFCCESAEDKSEESCKTEHKVIVAANNTQGYYDLIRIWNEAATRHFYYVPRVDFKVLARLWTKNLTLMIPFFDGFLHVNNFSFNSCFVDFGGFEPVFCLESHDLPFNQLLSQITVDYAAKHGFTTEMVNTCYYYQKFDFKAWMVYRCITDQRHGGKKKTLSAPELSWCSCDSFCYLRDDI